MLRCIYTYILLVLFFMVAAEGHAVEKGNKMKCDTIQQTSIYFEFRLNEVDSAYAANQRAIAWLDSQLADSMKASLINEVTTTSYVLPQGNAKFEVWLAAKRTATVKSFLKQRYPYLNKTIQTLQASDSLAINKARSIDCNLNRVEIIINRSCPAALEVTEGVSPSSAKNTDLFSVSEARRMIEKEYAVATEAPQVKQTTVLALKNNLLYDLALAPNLEVEVPIGKRWSLNTEFKCPWWLNSSRKFCYQLLSGGIETRYWLGKRHNGNRIIGHFVGLYAEGGIYDFQFGGDGYQGKYYGASGLTYGYVKQMSNHLALEFSLGVGYLTTEYRKYTPYKTDLIWTNSGRYNFIGPTKAKVSLVWLITRTRR